VDNFVENFVQTGGEPRRSALLWDSAHFVVAP